MENDKSTKPDGILIEVWKCLGEDNVTWLTKLFNEILRLKKMSDDWRKKYLSSYL